jgi:hypothetical protein
VGTVTFSRKEVHRPGPLKALAALGAGRPTTLSNLVLLCRRHHRAVHEQGYGVTRRARHEAEGLRRSA